MKFIHYYFPQIYEISINFLHGKNFRKRYRYIIRNIEENSNVLDIGCGTGILGKFLCKKCNYVVIDLNKKFLNFASKRGLKVFNCNAFNFKKYSKNVDTIVICDVLHHIYPRHKLFLEKIKNYADKIIICEPFYKTQTYESRKESLSFLEKIKTFLVIIFDSDGYNALRLRFNKRWWYNKKELKLFFKESLKNRKNLFLKEIGRDIIAIYNFKTKN